MNRNVRKLFIPRIDKEYQGKFGNLVSKIIENTKKRSDYNDLLEKSKMENNFDREITLQFELNKIIIFLLIK